MSKESHKTIMIITGFLMGLIIPSLGSASLTTESWYLDQSNTFADGTNFAEVTIEADSTAGTVKFTVTPFQLDALYGESSNVGIDRFGFNYQNISSIPPEWELDCVSGWSQKTDENLSGFGNFMVLEKGQGNNRQYPLIFTLTLPNPAEAIASNFASLSSGNASEGNAYFAAHVAGFDADPGSHWVGGSTIVPEPTTLICLLAGLFFGLLRKPETRFM